MTKKLNIPEAKIDLFNLEEFIGESEMYMIEYFKKIGWTHEQLFNDYKFLLTNDSIGAKMTVSVEMEPWEPFIRVSEISLYGDIELWHT